MSCAAVRCAVLSCAVLRSVCVALLVDPARCAQFKPKTVVGRYHVIHELLLTSKQALLGAMTHGAYNSLLHIVFHQNTLHFVEAAALLNTP